LSPDDLELLHAKRGARNKARWRLTAGAARSRSEFFTGVPQETAAMPTL
jgi:hypothetical protein